MSLSVLDIEGVDIGPLCEAAAARYVIPVVGLLAMLIAESELKRTAARYGIWPDVSFGYSQLIVATAAGYGIGDGSNTPANIAVVRDVLFDRATSIDVGAHHLSGCYGRADSLGYSAWGISHDLAALVIYNAGTLWPPQDLWWQRWAGNVQNYKAALRQAEAMISQGG